MDIPAMLKVRLLECYSLSRSRRLVKFHLIKKVRLLILIALILVNGVLLAVWLRGQSVGQTEVSTITADSSTPPEIEKILALRTVNEQEPELLKLLNRVGPEVAQEELYGSGLPFTGETHLLVHTIGNFIYKNYGSEGLKLCKNYFLSACYHAFIINDLADNGMEGLAKTIQLCGEAGVPVLSQCSHAAGHGFVAWNDYDLISALPMCDELGDKGGNVPLFNCYDGVFMENLFGVHAGEPSPKRWIKEDDRHYPCNDPRIPKKYLPGCWANQASLMYQMYRGNLEKVAEGCDAVVNPDHKETCYNNFARQIHPETLGKTDKAFELCKNATGKKWQNYCLNTLVAAAFSVGDQEKMPFEICNRISDLEKKQCYDILFGLISLYSPNKSRASALCDIISDSLYREESKGTKND